MGYIWAKWAWAWRGQPYLGPAWVLCGLSGLGYNWLTTSRYHMGFVRAPWEGARTGQPHLGPVSVFYGLRGYGLELVSYVRLPYRLFMG